MSAFSFQLIRPPNRHSTFQVDLLDANERRIVLAHELSPSKPLVFDGQEVLATGYRAVWFLFKGEPFDIGRIYRPDGKETGFYADILEPVRWQGSDPSTLEPLVDLFLDLWIAPDGRNEVLDEDEFQEAIDGGVLTGEQASGARAALESLVAQTIEGRFPPEEVRRFL